MTPVIRQFTDADRNLLARQIQRLWPASGIAGLYTQRCGRIGDYTRRLDIRCITSGERWTVAHFENNALLVRALPFVVAQMRRMRKSKLQRKVAA